MIIMLWASALPVPVWSWYIIYFGGFICSKFWGPCFIYHPSHSLFTSKLNASLDLFLTFVEICSKFGDFSLKIYQLYLRLQWLLTLPDFQSACGILYHRAPLCPWSSGRCNSQHSLSPKSFRWPRWWNHLKKLLSNISNFWGAVRSLMVLTHHWEFS